MPIPVNLQDVVAEMDALSDTLLYGNPVLRSSSWCGRRQLYVRTDISRAQPQSVGCREARPYHSSRGSTQMLSTVLRRFEQPDETRLFEKGRFEVVRLGGLTIGRAAYDPRW